LIELITFDLYGTLVDWRRSIASVLNYIQEGLVDRFFEKEYSTVKSLEGYIPYSKVLVGVLKDTLKEFGLDFMEEYGRLIVLSFAKSPFFPDALAGLLLLKKHGYRTGIISNTDRELVKITLAGVEDLFDFVVTAEDAGHYKPGKNAFVNAYRIMKVDPRKVLHVSSYPHYDLEPADQLGVETVCIDRYGYNWSTKLQSVNKLLDILSKRV
jgi:2-haloalkanoic acid dehalogenase type II